MSRPNTRKFTFRIQIFNRWCLYTERQHSSMKKGVPDNVQPPVSFRTVAAIASAAIIVLIAGMLLNRGPKETVEISNTASSQEPHASPASKPSLPGPRLSAPHRNEDPEATQPPRRSSP